MDNRIKELSDIVQISVGKNHVLAYKSNGEIYSFGNNHFGQLGFIGNGHDIPRIIPEFRI